jgi:hypothetical protein
MSLYPDVADFLLSDTFRGDKKPRQSKAYDQWLYIAAYKAYKLEELKGPAKFKIGYTSNYGRRNNELNAGKEALSFKASIVYAWPIPSAESFESEVKKYFKHFIHKDAFEYMNLGYRVVDTPTEIIWGLKLFTLVKLIRLLILKHTILKGFVGADDNVYTQMKTFLQPPDCIEDDDKRFANMMGSDYQVKVDNLIAEAQGMVGYRLLHSCRGMGTTQYTPLTEQTFYNYVIPSWRFLKSDELFYSNIPQGNEATTDENYLNLKVGDTRKFLYKGREQDCTITAYGKGPYLGAYIVEWKKNNTSNWEGNFIVEAKEIVQLRF